MNRYKTNLYMGFAFAMSLLLTAGCKRDKSVAKAPVFKDVPANSEAFKNNKVILDKNAKVLAANRQANTIPRQAMPQLPSQVNTNADIQRSLKTVEEINRMNRINQQLRQSQPQNRKP